MNATFRSLRHRNYRLYFLGQLVSLTGSWMQTTALNWLSFDLTHQSKWPALITTAQILPTFLFGARGGALADRWPKRRLILITQAAALVQALLLAAMVRFGLVSPWPLFVLTAVGGAIMAVDLPARLAFVMDMVGREDVINAVALNSVLFNVARIIGPAVAGLILVALGAEACFLVNSLTYLAVLWALLRMDVTGAPSGRVREGGLRALVGGFAYVLNHGELTLLFLLAGSTALCGWPFLSLLPAISEHRLELAERGYSWMLSGTGIGALLAAGTVATFGSVERRRRFLTVGVALISLGLATLALANSILLAILCCATIGFGLILFLATGQSVAQLEASEDNRGRVMGIWAMTLSGAVPLGNLLAGPAADRLGESVVLAIQGTACSFAAVLLALLFRRVRRTVP